jgi:hypothetical protein
MENGDSFVEWRVQTDASVRWVEVYFPSRRLSCMRACRSWNSLLSAIDFVMPDPVLVDVKDNVF